MSDFIPFANKPLKVEQLRIRKAKDLATALHCGLVSYASLVDCQTNGYTEGIIFDVEVELGQKRKNDIKASERIATVFHPDDDKVPETYALRSAFPLVPHINLTSSEYPRSLCLFDQPYADLKRIWTPQRYVERVRTWLALTAKGKLHQSDQPLEPLLIESLGYIALPSSFSNQDTIPTNKLFAAARIWKQNDLFVAASTTQIGSDLKFYPIELTSTPSLHGVIRHTPGNLSSLHDLLQSHDFNLIERLRLKLHECQKAEKSTGTASTFYGSRLILLILLPKQRTANGPVEANELLVFLTTSTIRDVGIAIDAWEDTRGVLGRPINTDPEKRGQSVEIARLNPVFNLSRESAWTMSGYPSACSDMKIVCIGAGALGSQVILNLARAGFGTWTIIDNDVLLPHNLVRHALFAHSVGHAKAEAVAQVANDMTDLTKTFTPIIADILAPATNGQAVADALSASDIVLDLSASVAVARHLQDLTATEARRISIFLNPTGTDLVILAEDKGRTITLDALEMQFYRALITKGELKDHFRPTDDRQRYGQTCRDVTNRIPQDSMALYGAIASQALRGIINEDSPRIAVWRTHGDLSISQVRIEPAPIQTCSVADWRLVIDQQFYSTVRDQRKAKLPNETGGVLIGSFDLERRIVYLVDTLPSPPDSKEWPTLYIRGSQGLESKVKAIVKATDGALQYVGEWHSHPKGHSTKPSKDDKKVFEWLTEVMASDGLPALMMIVGDDTTFRLFIGTME